MTPIRALTSRRAGEHLTGRDHPERPERLDGILRAVERMGIEPEYPADLGWSDERILEQVLKIHDHGYIARLRDGCARGAPYIDAVDSAICPTSFGAAVEAAGCVLAATEAALSGPDQRVFCAVRPPGHHCEYDRSMGFCLFNNVAIGAHYATTGALTARRVSRVAIVDFDVHHGNGTQHLFDQRDDVLFISMHQNPATLYPGTGYGWEVGEHGSPGDGFSLNIPLPAGSGHDEALAAFDDQSAPLLDRFRPELLFNSAGFDADARDPLGGLRWRAQTYRDLTGRLVKAAREHAQGRIVSVLEGGYDDGALEEDGLAHLQELNRFNA